jgi:hypothetical protein
VDLGIDPTVPRDDPERLAAQLMASLGRQSDDCAVLCITFGE